MSGAASLAAAKRRRSKVEATRHSQGNGNQVQVNNSGATNNRPQLNTQQSFQYIWQRLMQCEQQVLNNTVVENTATNTALSQSLQTSGQNVKIGSNYDDREIRGEIVTIQQNVASVQRSIDLLVKNKNSIPNTGNEGSSNTNQYIEVSQFNTVMSKVGADMEAITNKVSQLNEYLIAVQNNNIVLKNEIARLESQIGDNSSTGGLILNVNDMEVDTTLDAEGNHNHEDESEGEDDEDKSENEDEEEGENVTSTTTSDVLDKLKTLNSSDIKAEVAKELASHNDDNVGGNTDKDVSVETSE